MEKTMNPHLHITGTDLLLYQGWVGGQNNEPPTSSNKVLNFYFTRGGWGQNNDAPPPQIRLNFYFTRGGWGQNNEAPPLQIRY